MKKFISHLDNVYYLPGILVDAEDSQQNAGLLSWSRRAPGEMREQPANSRGDAGGRGGVQGNYANAVVKTLLEGCGWVTWPAGLS